jgi:tetratricopeptide (TPR) repeat protein
MLACFVFALALTACAARGDKGAEEPKSDRAELEEVFMRLSKPSRKHMEKVYAHIEKKEWDDALAELERMKEREHIDDYERAVMWQTFSVLYFERGDFEQSAAAGDEALRLNALPEKAKLRTQRLLGELYLTMERFDRAAELLGAWVAAAKDVKPQDHYIVASALAQHGKYAEALPHAKQAVDGDPKTNEARLKFLLSLHYELKQEPEVLATIERLVAAFPATKAYRLQMVESQRALGKDAEALATMERAYQDKLLDQEQDLTNLAQLYMDAEQPLKAGQLLDVHMGDGRVSRTPDNLRLLGKAWALAGDEDRAKGAMQAAEGNAAASK